MSCTQKHEYDASKTKNYLVQLSEAEASSPMGDLGAGKMPPDEYLENVESHREREKWVRIQSEIEIYPIRYRAIHTCNTRGQHLRAYLQMHALEETVT